MNVLQNVFSNENIIPIKRNSEVYLQVRDVARLSFFLYVVLQFKNIFYSLKSIVMALIRVTKEFRFEMAHALWNYDGLCKNIHGHSFILYVTVLGEPNTNNNDVKCGMVMDFGDLKRIVNNAIVKDMDHSLAVSEKSKHQLLLGTGQMFERHHILPYQPTCENMVIDFAERIKKLLPQNIKLQNVKLYETATSFAEWNADDNI